MQRHLKAALLEMGPGPGVPHFSGGKPWQFSLMERGPLSFRPHVYFILRVHSGPRGQILLDGAAGGRFLSPQLDAGRSKRRGPRREKHCVGIIILVHSTRPALTPQTCPHQGLLIVSPPDSDQELLSLKPKSLFLRQHSREVASVISLE